MAAIKTFGRITLSLGIFIFLAELAYALMPPYVYKEAIENSPIKAVAVVKGVTVIEKTKFYIEKKVEFELVESYGLVKPAKKFYGYCKSATAEPLVGGTIYYYPVVGEEVFVTLDSVSRGDDSGLITSYTLLDEDLRAVLKTLGLDGLEAGIGQVAPKLD